MKKGNGKKTEKAKEEVLVEDDYDEPEPRRRRRRSIPVDELNDDEY